MSSGVIVGIDTSTKATAVARARTRRARGRAPRRSRPEPAARHAEFLQPLLEQALEQAGATWADVTRIAVGLGPGGFTGLRLGGLDRPRAQPPQGGKTTFRWVGVSSLEALRARAVGMPEPQPGEPARSEPDGDARDVRPGGPRLLERLLEQRLQELGVAGLLVLGGIHCFGARPRAAGVCDTLGHRPFVDPSEAPDSRVHLDLASVPAAAVRQPHAVF